MTNLEAAGRLLDRALDEWEWAEGLTGPGARSLRWMCSRRVACAHRAWKSALIMDAARSDTDGQEVACNCEG
jgi:hypothetical protein